MPPREDENPDLNPLCGGDPLARRLAVLQPLPAGLDRDRLLYAAGAAARDRDVAFWRRVCLGQAGVLVAVVGVGLAAVAREPAGAGTPGPLAGAPAPAPAPPTPEVAPPPRPAGDEPAGPSGPQPQFARAPDQADPGEVARWLQLRADVFAAGLGVLPTPHAPPPPADATALEKSLQLPPGVLAAPHAAPKPKPEADPDQPE